MALTFNTGHALASDVTHLIAVDGGALVEVKSNSLTFTPDGTATFGTGTYGEHLRTQGSGYTPAGATWSPAIATNTASSSWTVFVVLNGVNNIPTGQTGIFDTDNAYGPNIKIDPVIPGQGDNNGYGTGTLNASGSACSIAVTRPAGDGTTNIAYKNGSVSVSAAGGFNNSGGQLLGIGGQSSGGSIDINVVYIVVFNRVLSGTEISDLHATLGASHTFGLLTSGDTTAPVLTTPTGTATGSSTATVGATTDEGNGTMYAVVTTSATQPSVAQIKAGQNHTGAAAAWGGSVAVSSTGAKTLNATGLTSSTTYYGHVVHTDAATNDSNRVSSSSFTTSAPPTITTAAFKNNTGSLQASVTIDNVVVLRASNRTLTLALTAQTTDASGILTIANAALTSGVDYLVVSWNTGLTSRGCEIYTAS